MATFRCATCNAIHNLDEISFGSDCPVSLDQLSDSDRANVQLSQEQCIFTEDGKLNYLIRARLQIPIIGKSTPFTWGVWCSLSECSFAEVDDHWQDPARTKLGPYFSWLCTRLPYYPDTMFMKAELHQEPVGLRPLVVLAECDHLLFKHQLNGIAEKQMQDIIVAVLHDNA